MKRIFAYLFSGVVTSVFLGGWLLYYFERHENQLLNDYGDALWFSSGTIVLLGLGDIIPQTIGGKVVAVLLMFVGFFFLASFATLGSWAVANRLLRERRNKIIIDVTPNSELEDSLEDLKHLSHLNKKRLLELEKVYEKIFHIEKIP